MKSKAIFANKKLQEKHRQAGMSLIEVIVGVFIVLVLFDLCIIEFSTLAISYRQRYENIAYHVANKQMENLRSTSLSSLPASGTISDDLLNQLPSGSGNYTVTDYAGYTGLKEFIVTVNWQDGGPKSIVIKTLAGSGGINP